MVASGCGLRSHPGSPVRAAELRRDVGRMGRGDRHARGAMDRGAPHRLGDRVPPRIHVAGVGGRVREHEWRAGIGVVVALGSSVLFTNVVKALTDRSRPPASHWLVNATGSAYPSGHAMDCLAVFGALALLLAARRFPGRHVAIPASAVIVLVVGWSRLYLGVHWLTDVVGGYLLAGAWVAAVAALLIKPGAEPARSEPYRPGPGP
ncbi:MAG: phosphatase PAP2 family protein [Actinobacteria bacterium]|nr:MAG: phosphatase PAP2 family protein [Actinomycetota bacterium]